MDALLLLVATGLVAAGHAGGGGGPAPSDRARDRLSAAGSLVVQMQRLDPRAIDRLDPDVLVTDYSRDGGGPGEWTRWDVRRLKWRWLRPPRLALAYLSVGEAEDYRYYWAAGAGGGRAAFLDRPNPQWPGNVRVRYWDPAWRRILRGQPGAWLDRVLDAGWDGVFLDTVDSAESFVEEGRADAAARMAELVVDLAAYARARRPGFVVVANNPFAVLDRPGVADALSGVVSEGHLMRGESLVPDRELGPVLERLRGAAARGLAVLVVEYPRTGAGRDRLAELCAREGFLCHAGVPALDRPGTVLRRPEAGRRTR